MSSLEVNVSILEVAHFTLPKTNSFEIYATNATQGGHEISRPNGLQVCWDEPAGDTYGLEIQLRH